MPDAAFQEFDQKIRSLHAKKGRVDENNYRMEIFSLNQELTVKVRIGELSGSEHSRLHGLLNFGRDWR
jgi:hypothetical protein